MQDYLVGYKFGVVWDGESNVEEYTIVNKNGDISKNEVNINTEFAKSLINKNKGDICCSKNNKFLLKYISCPSFERVCQDRNIKYLYHFSSIKNVDSIMKNGILSIEQLKRYSIDYDYNDCERLDRHNDFISCSIEFPNGMLLNYFKDNLQKKYVLFKINIDVLNYKYAKCSVTNAATKCGGFIENIGKLYKLYEGARLSMPNSFPTNEQAEILIKAKIEPQYIEQIIFENAEDELLFKKVYKTTVNANLFKYRDDFLHNKIKYITNL